MNKPVYIDGNPLNSYRRNGEGDYKCTEEELRAMYRDASVKTQDMLILDEMVWEFSTQKACALIGGGYGFTVRITRGGRWKDEKFIIIDDNPVSAIKSAKRQILYG